MNLAYQAFRLCLANNNDHAEAYNNLGVLEMRKGHVDLVSINFVSYFDIVKPFPTDKFQTLSNSKYLQTTNFCVGNIELQFSGCQHFLLFPECFQKSFPRVIKTRDCLGTG